MTQLLTAIGIFVFFFLAIGLVQLLGYRNMMCSCKARRYVQMRQQGIKDVQKAQEAPELITSIETIASQSNSSQSDSQETEP
ncbi:MAG: hypothetical protein IJQ39_01235 [Thermoguttaceae bacterium]|nr:hypothetical protein [Thermoguttaceae bacterium]